MRKPILPIAVSLLPFLSGQAAATEVMVPLDLIGEVASQSTSHGAGPAVNGIDGSLGNFTHTLTTDTDPWWRVDFGVERTFTSMIIYNRGDGCCPERLSDITLQALDETGAEVFNSGELNDGNALGGPRSIEVNSATPISAWAIKISRDPLSTITPASVLSIGELDIGGVEDLVLPAGTELTHAGIVNMTTVQSSTWGGNYSANGSEAVDGNNATETHTANGDTTPWWTVDFGEVMSIEAIDLFNRGDCCGDRLRDITIEVLDAGGNTIWRSGLLNPANIMGFAVAGGQPGFGVDLVALTGKPVLGQSVLVSRTQDPLDSGTAGMVLALGEVRVYGGSLGPDTDGDMMPDSWELAQTPPLIVGIDDSALNPDNDGLTNVEEFNSSTDPNVADTDGDGLDDGTEVAGTTLALVADMDGDGLLDGEEVNGDPIHGFTSDPLLMDTDGDGYPDGLEVGEGSDPDNASEIPNLTLVTDIGGLIGGDITDLENDGIPDAGTGSNFNWIDITASADAHFGFVDGADGAFNVFDNATAIGNEWWGSGPPLNVTVEFDNKYSLTHFTMTAATDAPDLTPVDFAIQGSNDGTTFVDIYPIAGSNDDPAALTWSNNGTKRFDLPPGGTLYKFFRYQVNTTGGAEHALAEIEYFGTIDPVDTDTDGMPDWYEKQYAFLDPNNADDASENEDAGDGDTLTNVEEYNFGTDPAVADVDGDGLEDGGEKAAGSDPFDPDSDNDAFNDGLEVAKGSSPTDAGDVPALNPIMWGTPQNITGDLSEINTTGTLVAAYSGTDATVTVGDITFGPGGPFFGGQYGGFDPFDRGGDLDYETLLSTGAYTDGGPRIMELTGLTPGETYLVQIWMVDTRSCCNNRTRTFSTDATFTDASQFADLFSGIDDDPNAPGHHVTGTFTAASETQLIYTAGVGGAHGPQYNALMVRQTSGVAEASLTVTAFSYDGSTASLTVSGFDTSTQYQLMRSENLVDFGAVGAAFTPTAETEVVEDTAPTGTSAYYRIEEVAP